MSRTSIEVGTVSFRDLQEIHAQLARCHIVIKPQFTQSGLRLTGFGICLFAIDLCFKTYFQLQVRQCCVLAQRKSRKRWLGLV
jgi:hypothetical protein